MSKMCPLFSGSSGNSTYLSCRTGAILVDAGATFRSMREAAASIDEDITQISAVLITHEHYDHIHGLKPLLHKTNATLIASEKTLDALAKKDKIPPETRVQVIGNEPLSVMDIGITRFPTLHDCKGSSGFVFSMPDHRKIAVCTDLGVITDEVRSALEGCDAVLLESNHDIDMLQRGPYPPELKMRILSEHGHLSNHACAAQLVSLLNSGTKRMILGHLSQKNNTPLLAESATVSALMNIGAQKDRDYLLWTAAPAGNGVIVV